MSWNTKGGSDSLPLGRGKSIHRFKFKGEGLGNSKFCKIAHGNHEEATGIPAFLSPEIAGIFTRGEKTLLGATLS